jgi:tetratricopeptide (TPR) repeat protein
MKRTFYLITLLFIISSGCNRPGKYWVDKGWSIFTRSLLFPESSIGAFDNAIIFDPEYDEAYYARGFVNSFFDNKYIAIDDFTKAIEINPKFSEAYFHRGLAYISIHKYVEAVDDFTKAVKYKGKWAFAYYHRGLIRSNHLKDYSGAINDFTQAIKFASKSDRAYIRKGVPKYPLYTDKGDFVDYTKPIEFKFPVSWYYKERGLAKIKLGQKDSGCSDLKKAIELGLASAEQLFNEYCQ